MAFRQAAAPLGVRDDDVLSADNAIPERHIIINILRNAAPLIGLKASVIATLDAMMSCLPPKRNHHTVFASNATLTFRRNGISDRTIRRHAAVLQDLGLLIRRDSPNRKRFTRHNTHEGKSLRFGFDLSPLFERLHEIAAHAAAAIQAKERISYLRLKIRTAANDILRTDPENGEAINALRNLRRNMSLSECEELVNFLIPDVIAAESSCDQITLETAYMADNDGQIVRHHHKSNKDNIDKKEKPTPKSHDKEAPETLLSIPELLAACPQAEQFLLRTVETVDDVIAHARTLAPMIGIDEKNYQAAQENLGAVGTAITVWALMQFHEKIHKVGAYFRSITSGHKSHDFNPVKLVKRLALSQEPSS